MKQDIFRHGGEFAAIVALGILMVSCAHATEHGAAAGASAVQTATMSVFPAKVGTKGPDGRNHDAFVPAGFTVVAGRPVQLAVVNYDDGPHTITPDDPGAGFGPFLVRPGKTVGHDVQPVTTTFDFTPKRRGAFRWHCEVACDGGANHWAMGQALVAAPGGKVRPGAQQGEAGFMAGYIVVQ